MLVNLGGIVNLSMVDYPGHSCISIFLRGCDKRCPWCHNKSYQTGTTYVDINIIFQAIKEASMFCSACIISGGEPLLQVEVVKAIAAFAHSLGMLVGVHTSLPGSLDSVQPIDYAWISYSLTSHRAEFYQKENSTTCGSIPETRAITRGLMTLSASSLAPLLENEPDIYTVEDLKVRFRQ